MMRWIFASTASLALIAAGVVHGFWTNRFQPDTAAEEAARRLAAVPMNLGAWIGEDVKNARTAPGVTGSVQRRYTNARLGATVVVVLVNGKPGPVATHTPEVCYGASGFKVGDRKSVRLDVNDSSAQFWTADAVREKVAEKHRIRLFWSWNGGEGWVASPDARSQFPRGRYPVLHKLYVIRELSGTDSPAESKDDPSQLLLQLLLPELEEKVFHPGT